MEEDLEAAREAVLLWGDALALRWRASAQCLCTECWQLQCNVLVHRHGAGAVLGAWGGQPATTMLQPLQLQGNLWAAQAAQPGHTPWCWWDSVGCLCPCPWPAPRWRRSWAARWARTRARPWLREGGLGVGVLLVCSSLADAVVLVLGVLVLVLLPMLHMPHATHATAPLLSSSLTAAGIRRLALLRDVLLPRHDSRALLIHGGCVWGDGWGQWWGVHIGRGGLGGREPALAWLLAVHMCARSKTGAAAPRARARTQHLRAHWALHGTCMCMCMSVLGGNAVVQSQGQGWGRADSCGSGHCRDASPYSLSYLASSSARSLRKADSTSSCLSWIPCSASTRARTGAGRLSTNSSGVLSSPRLCSFCWGGAGCLMVGWFR